MTKQTRHTKTRKGRSSKSMKGGDIPPPAKHTFHTMSYPLPKVTEDCVIRALSATTVVTVPSVSVKPTFAFTLGALNTGSGFFDQYMIEAIRFTVTPQNNAVGLVTNSTTTLLPLYVVIDYDDATALASAGAATSYSNCISLAPGESCERTFQPRIALAAYGGAFTQFANAAPQWLDSNSSGVQHYGVKLWVDPAAAGQTALQSWDITVEHFIRFRKAI